MNMAIKFCEWCGQMLSTTIARKDALMPAAIHYGCFCQKERQRLITGIEFKLFNRLVQHNFQLPDAVIRDVAQYPDMKERIFTAIANELSPPPYIDNIAQVRITYNDGDMESVFPREELLRPTIEKLDRQTARKYIMDAVDSAYAVYGTCQLRIEEYVYSMRVFVADQNGEHDGIDITRHIEHLLPDFPYKDSPITNPIARLGHAITGELNTDKIIPDRFAWKNHTEYK